MYFIFDLDQTLIDSSRIKELREQKKWTDVYKKINEGWVREFEGISELLSYLHKSNIKTAIVTSTPRSYLKKILDKFNWKIDVSVCYHDTKRKKPHPEPIFKALEKMGVKPDEYHKVFSFGDRDVDIIASNRAGVISVACLWGCEDEVSLRNSQPKIILENVSEVYTKILKIRVA